MDSKNINLSKETLENLTPEQLVDLKIEIEELLAKIENEEKMCDEILNS